MFPVKDFYILRKQGHCMKWNS